MAGDDDDGKLVLDKSGLQSFIDHDLTAFLSGIRKMRQDASDGPSMTSMLNNGETGSGATARSFYEMGSPLVLGQAGSSDGSINATLQAAGSGLNAALHSLATSISEVYTREEKLFSDLKNNLEATLGSLFDNQNTNLDSIAGSDFLDGLQQVEDDMGNTSPGSTGGDAG